MTQRAATLGCLRLAGMQKRAHVTRSPAACGGCCDACGASGALCGATRVLEDACLALRCG